MAKSNVSTINYTPRKLGYTEQEAQLGNKTLFATTNKNQTARYFSSIDAEIYFDDVFIDEVVQIQFQLQQNVMPLMGYNSYVYDDVALGSRFVQGAFAVNYTRAGYMYEIIETLKQASINSAAQNITKDSSSTLNEHDSNKPQVNRIKAYEKGPLWDKRFSIVMSYGDHGPTAGSSQAPMSTMIELTGIQLTGCSQALSHTGEPILEYYNFIARDIQFVPITEYKESTQEVVTNNEEKDIIDFIKLSYTEEKNKVMPEENEMIAMHYNSIYKQDASHLYVDKAVGYINIQYDSTADIVDIHVKPKLATPNRKSNTGAISLKDMNGSLGNPIKYRIGDNLRLDIKEHYNIYKNGQLFGADIEVIYRENGELLYKSYSASISIQNVLINL